QREFLAAVQVAVERLTLEQLHGEERGAVRLTDLVNGDDVVVRQGGGGTGLAQKAVAVCGAGGQARLHHLQRDGARGQGVLGKEDQAHAALAESLQDAVVGQPAQLAGGARRVEEREGSVPRRGRGRGGDVGRNHRLAHRRDADGATAQVVDSLRAALALLQVA